MSTKFPNVARRLGALAAVSLVALVSSAIGAYAGHGFSDVPNTHPFHDEIDWMDQKGIANGFEDGTYRPADAVTRQAMAAFLQRLANASPMEWEPNDTMAA